MNLERPLYMGLGWLEPADLKPNNVLLNWSLNETGQLKVERVVLSDMDCALKLQGEKLLDHRIGNVMWRSPEGQMGKGIRKPSEVFSFGLLVSWPSLNSHRKKSLLNLETSVSTPLQAWKRCIQTFSSSRKRELSPST
jgi:serine/threonine protein kinase